MILHWVHNISPTIVSLGPLEIRWYGLMYVIGFVFFYYWMKHLVQTNQIKMTLAQLENLFTIAIIGVLLGGRLGYVLFYNPGYYLSHPLDILKTWHGGMSFHGGALLPSLLILWYARKEKLPYWELIGNTAAIAPLALFFGRIGNFINGELYGRASDLPWAIIFPAGGNIPRHPSQLYEAFLEGVLLFGLLMWLHRKGVSGIVKFSVSVMGYAAARIFVEFFREPDSHLGYLLFGWLTMGQILSILMLLIGLAILLIHLRNQKGTA